VSRAPVLATLPAGTNHDFVARRYAGARGFAPEPLSYGVWSADGAAPRDVNPLSPRYKAKIALWQKLPLALANRLGPFIASGLA
jgi:hypothetical protein